MVGSRLESAPTQNIDAPQRLALGHALLIALVLLGGIGLRLRAFQKQEGLTRDEAALATNVVERDIWGMFKPLADDQASPVGHLLLLKLATHFLGYTDAALRLPGLVASILTLFVYLILARQCLDPDAQVLGLTLMGFTWALVEYGLSAKQYAGDVLTAVSLLVVVFWVLRHPTSRLRFVLPGLAGMIAIVFSHPAVFVLAGIGSTLIVDALLRKQSREALGWIATSAAWLATFLLAYALLYRHYAGNTYLTSFWIVNFAPFPPRSLGDLKWYFDSCFALFEFPLGIKFVGLAGACYLFGAYLLGRDDRRALGIYLAPLVVTLAASALKKYPFSGRLMLFACPFLATVTAIGVAAIGSTAREGGRVLRGIVVVLLLIYPAYLAMRTVVSGTYIMEDIKPALNYVAEHWKDDDVVYLNYGSLTLENYYVNLLDYRGLRGKPFVRGQFAGDSASMDEQLRVYGKDLEPLRGKKRVWLILSLGRQVQEPICEYWLSRWGVRLDAFHGRGSTALLYDLGG